MPGETATLMSSEWATVESVPPLAAGVIHAWCVHLQSLVPCVPYFERVLEDGERVRGDAYHAIADRERYVIARGVLRTLIGRYTELAPGLVRFGEGEFGKPHCMPGDGSQISFNVSHSGDFALLAFAREGELGVDVERWSARLGADERARLAESVFSTVERVTIERLSPTEQVAAFYSLWSRKEAYLKGTGAGISGGLAHVEISTHAPARLIADSRDARAVAHWELRDLVVGPGYSAALASSPRGQRVLQLQPALHLFENLPM